MGQLTNQYVSQSYQGLLNLENPFTGVTSTLQYVTDGIGNKIPMQVSTSSVVITGSFRGDGSGLTGVTTTLPSGTVSGSQQIVELGFATTSSLNTLSGSIAVTDLAQNNRLDSIEGITGSLATTSSLNSYTLTSSFNSYTSSNDSKVNDLISKTGSYVTESESGSFVTNVFQNPFVNDQIVVTKGNGSQSTLTINNVTSASFAQSALSSSYAPTIIPNWVATTGSNTFTGNQTINAQLQVSDITPSLGSDIQINASNLKLTGSLNMSGSQHRIVGNTVMTGALIVSSSAATDIILTGSMSITRPVGSTAAANLIVTSSNGASTINANNITSRNGNTTTGTFGTLGGFFIGNTSIATSDEMGFTISPVSSGVSGGTGNVIYSNDPTDSYPGMINFQNKATWTDGRISLLRNTDITGSLKVTGNITATSASFQYVNTVYETASVIYSSGSNQFGDEPSDTQTLYGTVSLPNGPLNVTGSTNLNGQVNVTTNLNVTQSLNVGGNSTFNQQTTYNGNIQYNSDSFIRSGSQINFNIGDGQDGAYYRLSRKVNGEFGIVQDPGNFHLLDISSSFAVLLPQTSFRNGLITSGSNVVSGSLEITGSLDVRGGKLDILSNNTTLSPDLYLTSSQAGQTNIILGWSDSPATSGPGATQANYTGSLRITGSNNIVALPLQRPTAIGGTADQQGYISGSNNFINTNQGGIYMNTGSLLFPKTQNNVLGLNSNILLTFTTSSLAGGHPTINNNLINGGGINISHPSGSVAVTNNVIVGGQVTSIQNFVTNNRPSIATNNVIGLVTLNHVSSSIGYNANYNNSNITVNNHLTSSALVAGNSVAVSNNIFLGGSSNNGQSIYISGSQATNATRNIVDNLIGGRNNIVSSSFVSSSNANLVSTIIYGNGLQVSGSHTVNTNGGSAFFGRFNATGSNQEDAQTTIFAVGTGTGVGARKTGLRIDNNSNTTISGSLSVIGSTNAFLVTGSGIVSHSVAGQPALTLIGQSSTQPGLNITGSLDISGSVTIASGSDLNMYGHKMFSIGQFQNNSTLSGSANVSQSMVFDVTDFSEGVSLVSGSRMTVANAGYYNIQFSAQIKQTGGGSASAHIWFKKNGTNVPESATRYTLPNNTYQVAALNFASALNANDYVEIAWQSDDASTQLLYEAPTGNIPAVPSVIATVTQIR